jgi:hypothetical protein
VVVSCRTRGPLKTSMVAEEHTLAGPTRFTRSAETFKLEGLYEGENEGWDTLVPPSSYPCTWERVPVDEKLRPRMMTSFRSTACVTTPFVLRVVFDSTRRGRAILGTCAGTQYMRGNVGRT